MPKMRCPDCQKMEKHKTVDCRTSIGGFLDQDYYIWRRRLCSNCGKRFTTIEVSAKTFNKFVFNEKGKTENGSDESGIHNRK